MLISEDQCIDVSVEEQFLQGDLNQDNYINVSDIVLLVDWILNGGSNESGDLNQDGYINVSDIVMLVDLILNPQ